MYCTSLFLYYYNFKSLNIYNVLIIYLNNFWANLLINLFFSFIYIYYCLFLLWISIISVFSISVLRLSKKSSILLNFFVGYYKIHPMLFYLFNHSIIYYFLKKNNNFKIVNILITTLITFSLGSLWALYQNIWGYYWSNDSIEYILLLLSWFLLLYIHRIYKNIPLLFYLSIFSIFFLIILLRLGFLYTKHNFFKSLTDYDRYFMLLKIFILLNNTFFVEKIIYKKQLSKFNLYFYIFIILILSIFCSILGNIYLIFFSFFFIILLLFTSFYLLSIYDYSNQITHILFFIFTIIYCNYSINYFVYYYNFQTLTIFNNNIFFKHQFRVSFLNKFKKTIYIGEKLLENNKFINNVLVKSFKSKSFTQSIVNYF